MRGPGRLSLAVNAGCLGLLGWLYGPDCLDGLRARSAEVVAQELPTRAAVASVVLAATALATLAFVYGLARGRDAHFKGYRLLAIVTALAVFAELFLLSQDELSLGAAARMELAVDRLGAQANALAASSGKVPAGDALRPMLPELGDPPYRVRGQPARGFSLQIREGCDGPVAEAPGAGVGTFLYCVARDGKTAWLTGVGLPVESRFGAPAVFSRGGRPYVVPVTAPEPDKAPAAPAP